MDDMRPNNNIFNFSPFFIVKYYGRQTSVLPIGYQQAPQRLVSRPDIYSQLNKILFTHKTDVEDELYIF